MQFRLKLVYIATGGALVLRSVGLAVLAVVIIGVRHLAGKLGSERKDAGGKRP